MRKPCKKAALGPSPNNHSYFCLFTLPAERRHIYDLTLENFMWELKNYQVAVQVLPGLAARAVSMKKHEFTPWLVIDRMMNLKYSYPVSCNFGLLPDSFDIGVTYKL